MTAQPCSGHTVALDSGRCPGCHLCTAGLPHEAGECRRAVMGCRVRPEVATSPAAALEQLGAVWSDDFDAYASGETTGLHCALCQCAPCRCPAFGTDAYFALLDQRHGRIPA